MQILSFRLINFSFSCTVHTPTCGLTNRSPGSGQPHDLLTIVIVD
jgi:hypothetical protein